jgi:class 3 adenylate cyclase
MITDLRGFTSISEQLKPEQVVQLLNSYFQRMFDVAQEYGGTIDEISGDSLLLLFGAHQDLPERSQKAVACAIAMQNAMAEVNEANRTKDLPELEMGIGINEAEVIVGNVGSSKRSKYGVVGSGVNMTHRIQSYATGGQILISESVRKETCSPKGRRDRSCSMKSAVSANLITWYSRKEKPALYLFPENSIFVTRYSTVNTSLRMTCRVRL